jgi:hypothetical protein
VAFEVSAEAAFHFIAHLYQCIDHRWLDELTQEAFEAFARHASAVWHEGRALAASLKGEADFAKACVRESAGIRTLVAGTPPVSLAESLRTLMAEPDEKDFNSILLILNGCGPYQLRSTLRNLPGTLIVGRENAALEEGKSMIRGFAKNVKAFEKFRNDYLSRVESIFADKGA